MSNSSSEYVELFHDRGLFLPTRTIYLGSESSDEDRESGVDALMAAKLIKNIRILDSISHEPITIVANNPGGDTYHGLAIYDAIKNCKSSVTMEVFGHAMSLGSIILQAADYRFMSENSMQMMHYGSLNYEGHSLTSIKWSEQEKKINNRIEQIYLRRMQEANPAATLLDVQSKLDHDTFLTAQESVDLGLSDGILGPSRVKG